MGKADKVDYEKLIRIAADEGAKSAMRKLDEERKRICDERTNLRLRNTGLLLKNYRLFKKHTENAVYQAEQLDESVYDILELMERRTPKDFVSSIKNSVARTATILGHVDAMLVIYHAYCELSGKAEDLRRWRVVKALYIDEKPLTAEELANREFVSTRTIDRDVAAACDILSTLLFGIDGVKRD